MASNHCTYVPDAPNGKRSKLFDDLYARLGDREMTKMVWAFTKTKLFSDEFTDLPLDENGEYTVDSIVEVLGLDKVTSEYGKDHALALSLGVIKPSGAPATFQTSTEAMAAADRFNSQAIKTVAVVVENEDGTRSTEVRPRTPENIVASDNNKARAAINKVLLDFLNRLGFDISFMDNPDFENIFDPLHAEENARLLKEVIKAAKGERGFEGIAEEVSHLILAGLDNHPLKIRIDSLFTPEVVRRVLGKEYGSYYRKYKNGRTPIQIRLRDEAEGKVLAAIFRESDPKENTISVAPYFRSRLTSANRQGMIDSTQSLHETAKRLAKLVGLKISGVKDVEGQYLGSSEISYRYSTLSTDEDSVNLLSALLADVGFEYQDSVIAANYVSREEWEALPENRRAIELVYKVPKGTTVEEVEATLQSLEIDNSSRIIENDELCITVFSEEQLVEFTNKLNNNTNYEYERRNFQNSRFLENSDRRIIYESWLTSHDRKQARELYDTVSKALAVCEAAGEHPGYTAEAEQARLNAANEAAEQWDSDNDASPLTKVGDGIKSLFRRLVKSFLDLFKGRRPEDIDSLIANARSEMASIARMTISGEIDPIIDKELIMRHEFMNELKEQTDEYLNLARVGEVTLSQRLSILESSPIQRDTRALRQVIKDVREDIEKQQYYWACYRTMSIIGQEIQEVMYETDHLGYIHNGTTDLNLIAFEADLVKRIQTILEGYAPYLEEMARFDTLRKKGQIKADEAEAKQIEEQAEKYLHVLRDLRKESKELRFSVIKQLVSLYYGINGEKPDTFEETSTRKWESIDTLLHYAENDITFWDTTVFSAGDSRNPFINVIHNIIASQQRSRDIKINKLTAIMREAEVKLQKAGHDNKFVYQFDENGNPTGYYVGPVDMAKFEKARADYWNFVENSEDFDYYEQQRMKVRWEDENMEEVEVGAPNENGERRKERLPRAYDKNGNPMYANPDFDANWSDAQKDYYRSLLNMKAEMDEVLPPSMRGQYTAPQVRKSVSQMFDKDGRGALATVWGQWKSKYTFTDDNMDFGSKEVNLGFNNKPIKRVPVYFIHKLEDMRDLSTDATHAMFNYIAMAANYSEMGQLADAMELIQDYVNDTDDPTGGYQVQQVDAGKPIIGWFKAMGEKYMQKYTKSGPDTRIAKAITKYIDRNVFNETRKKIGNVRNPFNEEKPISIDNMLSTLLRLTSVSRMGINVLSGITNVTQGETQMLNEARAGRWFNFKDYGWAQKEYAKLLIDYMSQFNSIDRHDKMFMLINELNSSEDFFRDIRDVDFNDSAFKRVLGKGNIMFLSTMGEHKLHTMGMLMILNHERVKVLSGKKKDQEMTLYDAIKQVHDDKGWHLELIGDIEFLNKKKPFLISNKYAENGKVKADERDVLFEKLGLYINNINAGMHGGYSELEKGNLNQHALAQFINQFRQWMWGMYNKLYSGDYYDAVMMVQREGAYRSFFRFFFGTIHDLKNMSIKQAIEQNKLSPQDMQNLKVAWAQAATFLMLTIICSMTMGWKDDDKRSARLLAYSLLRLRTETGALVPWPSTFFKNIFTLVQSPAAAVNSLETLTTLLDMNSYWNEVGSGRFKGWPKAIKAAYTMTPVYNIGKLIDMKDYNYMFNIFN